MTKNTLLSKILRFGLPILVTAMVLTQAYQPVLAQITNPAIGVLGGNDGSGEYNPDPVAVTAAQSGASLLGQFVRLWGNVITIGVIMVLIMFIWGALEWITAGGDAGKIGKARDRMLQSAIGLLVLVSLFILIGFLSGTLFGDTLDILKPKFVTPTSTGASP